VVSRSRGAQLRKKGVSGENCRKERSLLKLLFQREATTNEWLRKRKQLQRQMSRHNVTMSRPRFRLNEQLDIVTQQWIARFEQLRSSPGVVIMNKLCFEQVRQRKMLLLWATVDRLRFGYFG
jgi:hypothetical protein